MTRRVEALVVLQDHDEGDEDFGPRPATRGECREGERPCPWVACRYHLAVEIGVDGSLRQRRDPDPIESSTLPTCALDVAAEGEHTLGEIGAVMTLARERVRQIELLATRKFRAAAKRMGFDLVALLPPELPAGHAWAAAGDEWIRGEATPAHMKRYQAKRYQAKRARKAGAA